MTPSRFNTPTQPVIVDTRHSRFARLRPAAITAVVLEDEFWRPRREINRAVMIPAQYELCLRTGRIDNFRRAAGKIQGEHQGEYYNDSDVYKLLESAVWALVGEENAELQALVDGLIDDIASAQQSDGYLNTYFMFEREAERWTNYDLHEMYCAGHLMQAAIAHYRSTGESKLLDVATRFADHICDRFGPEDKGKQFGNDGHPEVEMAFVELYRATGNPKYLEQAQYLVGNRGAGRISPSPFQRFPQSYHQDHLPFRELSRLEGHAVRAVYLNCGATDIAAEQDDPALWAAVERMWQHMTARQMYVTGGLGSRYQNEGFGEDYELPNASAYAETCAAVANFMWNWRLLLRTAEGRYADLMELELYNGALSGVSLDGKGYFYQNPLSDNGQHRRQEWFSTACCPGNISRLLSQMPGYIYSTSERAVWVHLYASNTATLTLPDDSTIQLMQRTNYPWSGEISIETLSAGSYALYLRLPGWCESAWSVEVNGNAVDYTLSNAYLCIKREWQAHDVVQLDLPMPVVFIESHPLVIENQGRVAVMRGPLLYCVEGVDHSDLDLRLLEVSSADSLEPEYVPELLDGVVVLRGTAHYCATDNWGDSLYRSQRFGKTETAVPVQLTAVPYYAWANRAPSPMLVWLRFDRDQDA